MTRAKTTALTAGLLAFGLGAAAAATAVRAQDAPVVRAPMAQGGAGGGMPGLLEAYDADGDGAVTQAEVDAARAGRLAAFDADGDGVLSLAEYQALWLDAYAEQLVDAFQRHDDNSDARITVDEFGDDFRNLVARMDADGDGRVTAADLQRPARAEQQREDGNGRDGGRRGNGRRR